MKLLIISLALFAYTPGAEARKVDLKPKHEKPEDPGSATPLLYKSPKEQPDLGAKPSGVTVNSTCTDGLGMIHKSGSASFESCIRNQNKILPNKANESKPNSLGITFGK